MRPVELIAKKRDRGVLTSEELHYMVHGYSTGEIPEYQMAAWLMAVCCRGLSLAETTALTMAMASSGEMLDLSGVAPVVVDKHSTGGVGDGTSLIFAPLVAACGVPVAKVAGRSLAFTGGTIDKLEAIPGLRVDLDAQRFVDQLRTVGLVIGAQSADLVPADSKLYALRDVTATVPSAPLIASSIMSKKIAVGATAIVLDVKVGRGAFVKTPAAGCFLAEMLVGIATTCGRRATAILSAMEQPVGKAVGNALEVAQAIETLKGGGPADLKELSLLLAAEALVLAGETADLAVAWRMADSALDSGAALEKLAQMIRAQGGSDRVVMDPSLLPQATTVREVAAPRAGFVQKLDALAVGKAVVALGGGRLKKGEPVDPAVGVALQAKEGDWLARDETLALIHARDDRGLAEALALLRKAYKIGATAPPQRGLVLGRVGPKP